MASLILMTVLALFALAIAIVPVTIILWNDAHAKTPVESWASSDDRLLAELQLAGGAVAR